MTAKKKYVHLLKLFLPYILPWLALEQYRLSTCLVYDCLAGYRPVWIVKGRASYFEYLLGFLFSTWMKILSNMQEKGTAGWQIDWSIMFHFKFCYKKAKITPIRYFWQSKCPLQNKAPDRLILKSHLHQSNHL